MPQGPLLIPRRLIFSRAGRPFKLGRPREASLEPARAAKLNPEDSKPHAGTLADKPFLWYLGAPAASYLSVVNYVISTDADQLIRQPADQLRGTPGHGC